MSFGSISKEAHETIAIAMNRLGAASNSGEGGEDEERYIPLPNGDSKKSAIKQVASGRFGVTSNYLVNSRELQIKMAQGAKPGEGGQLPGDKVDEIIAKVGTRRPASCLSRRRRTTTSIPSKTLRSLFSTSKARTPKRAYRSSSSPRPAWGPSPPASRKGRPTWCSSAATTAAPGASPLSSIKYAGIPWEIGLADTQQTLVMNRLRDRIRVQVDGQLRTGRDVVIGALLGAEEFGFGTIALVTSGAS